MSMIKGITLKIGGDTTGLDKAISSADRGAKELDKSLREIKTSLKYNPESVELLAQKHRTLGERVTEARDKVQMLHDAEAQMREQLARGDIDQGQWEAYRREVIKAENQLKTFEGELAATAKQMDELNKSAKLDKISEGLKHAGEKMTSVGKKLSIGVTAPIVAIGAAAHKAWSEVDGALDTITAKTGATGETMKSLEASFRNAMKAAPLDIQKMGEAIGEVNTQFGLMGEPLEQLSAQLVKFSELNDTDVSTSIQQTKAALEAFGEPAENAGAYLDALTVAGQQTGVAVDKIADAVVKGAPQLRDLGINTQEAAVMMAHFEQKGIDSSKMLVALGKAQTLYAQDGMTLAQGLEDFSSLMGSLSTDQERLTRATEMFGQKAGPVLVDAWKRGALSIEQYQQAAEGVAGATEKTLQNTRDPVDKLTEIWNMMKLSLYDVATAAQEMLLPVFEKLAGWVAKLMDAWRGLSPETQKFIVSAAAIAAASGPVLAILGKLTTGIGVLVKIGPMIAGIFSGIFGVVAKVLGFVVGAIATITGLPVAAVAAIGVALAAIVAAIIYFWDDIKAFFSDAWEWLKDSISALGEWISETVTAIWEGVKSTAETVWNGLKSLLDTVWNAIKTAATTAWNGIKSALESVWNGLKSVAETVWNGLKSLLDTVWNAIKTAATAAWNGIKSALEAVWNGIKSAAESLWNGLKSLLDTVWTAIKTAATAAWNGIKSALEAVWNGIKSAAESLWNGLKTTLSSIWTGIKDTAVSLWTGLKDAVVGVIKGLWEGIKDGASKIASGFVDALKFLPEKIVGIFKSIYEKSLGWVNKIGEKIKSAWNWLKTGGGLFGGGEKATAPKRGARATGPQHYAPIGWFDRGGIFTRPTVIGVGERRPEFVGALDDLRKIVREEQKPGNITITIDSVTVRSEDDIRRIAEELQKRIEREGRIYAYVKN